MQLVFLGKETDEGQSPTLYATDRQTYIVQGWKVTDPEILAKLDIQEGETVVEVPAALFSHLAKDGVSGAVVSWVHPIVHVKDDGNYIVQGVRLTDSEALAGMEIPGHEDSVEVPKAQVRSLLEEEHGSDG